MKSTLFIAIAAFFFSLNVLTARAENGKIVFYRPSNYLGMAVDYKIFVNDSLIRLRNNSYNTVVCKPNSYSIALKNGTSPALRLFVEENRTYYVSVIINQGFWTASTQLILVDSLSAAPNIKYGGLKDLNNPALWQRPKRQLGITLSLGGGFSNIDMVTTTNNETASLSCGGGWGIGLEYNHQMSKHFETDFNLSYHNSGLQPYVKNVTDEFSRTKLSVTPLYVFNVGDGYNMRWKLGGGLDYYLSPSAKLREGQIQGGINDDWSYDNTFGYHVRGVFEMNLDQNWGFHYGLDWYTVSYKINSGHTVLTDFVKPNGSGIDLMFGVYYAF